MHNVRTSARPPARDYSYHRQTPLILINGLAEQPQTWFANKAFWSRYYDVKVPELLVYNGESLHKHIEAGGEVTIDYLADRLATYLDEFVQTPPYDLVASSLGGQIAMTYAANHPDKVSKVVLICTPGMHGKQNLPLIDGMRRSQYDMLVESVFHQPEVATDELLAAFEAKFGDRKWRTGVVRTLRGTLDNSVAHLVEKVVQPTLVIWGADDNVITDVPGAIRSASRMNCVRQVVIPHCGHAPQIEKPALVNKMVLDFLQGRLEGVSPNLDPDKFLRQVDAEREAAETTDAKIAAKSSLPLVNGSESPAVPSFVTQNGSEQELVSAQN